MSRPRLPPSEGENVPVSFRMGERLVARVEAIAKASGWNKSDVMIHFIRWACDEYEAEADSETRESASPSDKRAGPDRRGKDRRDGK